MNTHFIFQILIYLFLLSIAITLVTGLYYIVNPSKRPERVAQALTTRISMSIALLLIISFAIFMDWFQPMSLLTMPKVLLESNIQTQRDPTKQNLQNASTTLQLQNQNDV